MVGGVLTLLFSYKTTLTNIVTQLTSIEMDSGSNADQ